MLCTRPLSAVRDLVRSTGAACRMPTTIRSRRRASCGSRSSIFRPSFRQGNSPTKLPAGQEAFRFQPLLTALVAPFRACSPGILAVA